MGAGDNAPMSEFSPGPEPHATSRAAKAWWARPWLVSLVVVLLLLGLALAWPLLRPGSLPAAGQGEPGGLPWQVKTDGQGGSLVLGLRLGSGRLGEVEARFGDSLRVGLIQPMGQPQASLEGFVETLQAGFVTGRLVLAFEAEPAWLAAALVRSPRHEVGEGGRSRRHGLAADDLPQARQAPLVGLTFLPAARLDEATLVQRFGAPAERLTGPAGEAQLLYPALGVAVAVPATGAAGEKTRVVIQYVAPRDFERRLRAPLRAALAASAAG
jgi:hypothetical protein